MKDYIKRIYAAIELKEMELLPDGLCPFLYYNLLPYIACIAREGKFGWIKYSGNSYYRKVIDKSDFIRRDVNRLYINEVLVRCPNNRVNLVCGIGPYGESEIKIRILDIISNCPNKHNVKDEFLIKKGNALEKAREWNRLFHYILYKSYGHRESDMSVSGEKCKIKVDYIIAPCRYSRKGQNYDWPFMPQDFCIHLFQLVYPDILSVMYNAKVPECLEVRCHCQNEPLKVSIKKEKVRRIFILDSLINSAETIFEKLFYPYDMLDYRIRIIVSGKISTRCNLKNGFIYEVNLRDKNFICPASLHALYPYLILAVNGLYVRCDDALSGVCIPCPDYRGTVYDINGCYKQDFDFNNEGVITLKY